MSFRHLLQFGSGLCCYALAVSMYFYFPGLEPAFSDLNPFARAPGAWMDSLLVLLIALPALLGPLGMAVARRHARPRLALCCVALAAFFLVAAQASTLLYARVAVIALLTGQLLALGHKAKDSVPFNWMVYMGFMMAHFSFPDAEILAGANYLAGAYLFVAGALVLQGTWKIEDPRGFSVMVG